MPTIRKLTDETLEQAVAEVSGTDPDLARIREEIGVPPPRQREAGFASLIRAITSQQLSVASAAAILGRLESAVDPLTPEGFLALSDDELKAIGFSRQKTGYGRDLARHIVDGELDFGALDALPDEEAIAMLTRVRGIGRWTAEVYLLFAHGRADMWPVDDLALIVAVQRLKGLAERPDRKQMLAFGEPWRPLRGAAARMLWHYYRTTPAT